MLSHQWVGEEVTLKNLTDGTGDRMAGYDKIQLCGEQARRAGLRYFGVELCIAVELAEAIDSMFRTSPFFLRRPPDSMTRPSRYSYYYNVALLSSP